MHDHTGLNDARGVDEGDSYFLINTQEKLVEILEKVVTDPGRALSISEATCSGFLLIRHFTPAETKLLTGTEVLGKFKGGEETSNTVALCVNIRDGAHSTAPVRKAAGKQFWNGGALYTLYLHHSKNH